jgi:hypothetical protein
VVGVLVAVAAEADFGTKPLCSSAKNQAADMPILRQANAEHATPQC